MTKLRTWLQRHPAVAYTALFVLASALVFSFIPVLRKSLVHAADGFNQCYPTYVYIGRYIREFLLNLLRYHTVPMFDFSIGYGDDVLSTLNWFGLGNVIYLLAALAPAKFASILFTAQSILQLYLAGLAFLWTSSDYSQNHWSRVAGSLIYAFSAYALSFGINFPSFLLVFVTFPIVMSGVTRILTGDTGELSGRYIAAIFILSCSGFYFLYMDIIAIAVYGILYGIFHYRGRVWRFLQSVGAIVLQTGIAVGMSAVILLPVVLTYLHSARSGEQSGNNEIFSLFSAEEIMDRLTGVLDLNTSGTAVGFTIPIIILLVIFLARYREQYPVLSVGLVICVVGYFIPATGSIMNGFSYSIDRWIYILNYLVAVVVVIALPRAAEYLQQEGNLRRLAYGVAAGVYLVWALASVRSGSARLSSIVIHILVIGITLAGTLLMERRSARRSAVYCVACTILVAFLYYAPTLIGGDGAYASFKNFYTWHEIKASAFANAETDESFYRTDIYDSSLNGALVTQTNGASSYYSIGNGGPFLFLNARLVSTGTEGSSFTLRGLDGRKALEMFFSVHSYALDRTADEIVTNDLQLPLGFTYTSYMTEENAKRLDPLDRNQNILKVVELEDAPTGDLHEMTTVESEWDTLPCEYSYYDIKEHEDDQITAGENAEIRVVLPDGIEQTDQAEYYLVLHGLEWLESGFERHLEVGGKRMRIVPMGSYPGQSTDYMIKVDLTQEMLESKCLVVQLDAGEYTLTGLELRRLDISQYEEYYEQLTESVLEDVTYEPNRISGRLTTNQDRILLMTIPYSTGWTCTVDGAVQEVLCADQGYSAVVIGAGEHEVVWTYCTPGLVCGGWITVASVLLLLLIMRRENKRRSVDH